MDIKTQSYEAELAAWQAQKEQSLRSDTGWLTLAGLHWLHEGENTVGSDPVCDVALPVGTTPARIGTITLHDGVATLTITTDHTVTVDDQTVTSAVLRNDHAEGEPSIVRVEGITFFVIKREDQYGVRVRDINNPDRQHFSGRRWYPIRPDLRVRGHFRKHAEPRYLTVINSVGMPTPMENPGWVEFVLDDQALKMEAFTTDNADKRELWFIFKDKTNGKMTYGAGRFLYADMLTDAEIDLDFNRSYSPPCAFTHYATCPMPPRENYLPVPIEAGEMNHGE